LIVSELANSIEQVRFGFNATTQGVLKPPIDRAELKRKARFGCHMFVRRELASLIIGNRGQVHYQKLKTLLK
jgi:hypothetical protein